jgi:catechol 2,3-dioxygenase-like lactoylglutathione lyase family enzyme
VSESPKPTEESQMLGDMDVIPTIAVKDVGAASSFYEGTLGLHRADVPNADPTAIVYRSGRSGILVYQSEYAGTNQATSASWSAGAHFDEVLGDLRSKGVAFEHYDLPGATREGDVHVAGDLRAAWFKDPDGNILAVVDQEM